MRRVDLAFEDLRPVAAHARFRRGYARVRGRRERRWFERGHLGSRPYVAPLEAAGLARRIGLMFHALRNVAFGGLGRHLDHIAFDVELPAVIETAQSALLVARVDERSAPVRAVFVEHAEAASGVAEHD